MSVLLGLILKLAGSGALDRVLAGLKARADGAVERERIDATVAIAHINAELARRQAQRDLVLAEQGHWPTRLMRPAFAYPLAAYYAAVIADSLFWFDWNVAALPAPIGEWSGWIISALFLADAGERITRTIMRRAPEL
ncbi:MAG: hypothetical protein WD036_10230 [Bauldia sp.]